MTPQTAPVLESLASPAWEGRAAAIAVIVSTHGRGPLLDGLLDALAAQDHPDFEVVVADNGSGDDTWARLTRRCGGTGLRLLALRLAAHPGPAAPRNTAVAHSRARLLAFTDDDCLPDPGWLSALTVAAGDDVGCVQGRVEPVRDSWAGPWARSVLVDRVTGLFETANLGCSRAGFDAVGGFPVGQLAAGRAFGEDVLFGARLAERGRVVFAGDAVVRHRLMPSSYAGWLTERRRLAGFPLLVREAPQLRRALTAGVFLSPRTATVDLGLAGVALAAGCHRPGPAALAVPWLLRCWRDTAHRPGRPRAVRTAQVAVGDLLAAAALLAGSARHRRLVL